MGGYESRFIYISRPFEDLFPHFFFECRFLFVQRFSLPFSFLFFGGYFLFSPALFILLIAELVKKGNP